MRRRTPDARTFVRAAALCAGGLVLAALIPQGTSTGIEPHAEWLRGLVHASCGGYPERALSFSQLQTPVCARCFGLYSGLMLGALMRVPWRTESLSVLLGLGLIVMALDVASERLLMRPPFPALRLLTGLLVSLPTGWLIAAEPGRPRDKIQRRARGRESTSLRQDAVRLWRGIAQRPAPPCNRCPPP